MKNSNGGICYNDLMNMGIPEILKMQNEVTEMIAWENKEIKKEG
jgi:hypothetical protein